MQTCFSTNDIPCNGNGICQIINNITTYSECQCTYPWSYASDLVKTKDSCTVNLIVVQVMYGLLSVLLLISTLPLSTFVCRRKIKNSCDGSTTFLFRRKKRRIILPVILSLTIFFAIVFHSTFVLYRTVHVEAVIGTNSVATGLFYITIALGGIFYHLVAYSFVDAQRSLITSSYAKQRMTLFIRFLPVSLIISLAFWIGPVIVVYQLNDISTSSSSNAQISLTAESFFYVGAWSHLCAFGCGTIFLFINPFLMETSSSPSTHKEKLHAKYKSLRFYIYTTSISGFIGSFCLAFIPIVQRSNVYGYVLGSLFLVPILNTLCVIQLNNKETTNAPGWIRFIIWITTNGRGVSESSGLNMNNNIHSPVAGGNHHFKQPNNNNYEQHQQQQQQVRVHVIGVKDGLGDDNNNTNIVTNHGGNNNSNNKNNNNNQENI
jgi:hypothetical protein